MLSHCFYSAKVSDVTFSTILFSSAVCTMFAQNRRTADSDVFFRDTNGVLAGLVMAGILNRTTVAAETSSSESVALGDS
jgi:hypothetical protein